MKILSRALASEKGLTVAETGDTEELLSALSSGKMAIVNVGGDRGGYKGIFSTGGHYVAAVGYEAGEIITVDPGMYEGKYNAAHRRAVKVNGDILRAAPGVIAKDAENRNPRFYIFGKK